MARSVKIENQIAFLEKRMRRDLVSCKKRLEAGKMTFNKRERRELLWRNILRTLLSAQARSAEGN